MKLIIVFLSILSFSQLLFADGYDPYRVGESFSAQNDMSDSEEEWQELGNIKLPPYPEDSDLKPFQVTAFSNRYEFLIDNKNIELLSDNIIRYTAVIKSKSGAENTFFEGIDCRTNSFKSYAYGQSDKTFKRITKPEWEPLSTVGMSAYRYELSVQYFCTDFKIPYSLKQIKQKINAAMQLDFSDPEGRFYN